MARKDLLKGLMGEAEKKSLTAGSETDLPPAPADKPAAAPRYSRGAIGAVSQSIAELKSRAVVEIVADQIDPGGLLDRMDDDPEGIEALQRSIAEYGQQVPVLVRHDPNTEGRYQVVYGRRRVAALKALKLPVKAIVRQINDHDLVIAQGQENAARRDLSFIEKANFARQMRDMGFKRKVIADALHLDKTVLSRMMNVIDGVPEKLIRAIGSAPSVGRDRWQALADAVARDGRSPAEVARLAGGESSDARFDAVLAALKPKASPPARPAADPLTGRDGATLGQVSRRGGKTVVTFDARAADGFDDWLLNEIEGLHARYLEARDG